MMKRKLTALKIFSFCIALFSFQLEAQTIVYVDQTASGLNDGSSWSNAFTDIQSALDEAAITATEGTPNQVWVKSGTYYPTSGTNASISLSLKNNVELFGGFGGTETTLSQRDFKDNITTLSGNIGNQADSLDNSDVIVSVSADITDRVLIDGFHLEGAYGTGAVSGAIHYFSSPGEIEVHNCTFRNNFGLGGSAISGFNGTVNGKFTLVNSFFIDNGAFNLGSTSAVAIRAEFIIHGCVFTRNKASGGGAISLFQGEGSISNCTFYDNSAIVGSAITVNSNPVAVITTSIFWGNSGTSIHEINTGTLLIQSNLIQGGYSGSVNTIDADPQFFDAPALDLQIRHCSPAVDQGGSVLTAEDINGSTRVVNGAMDWGAYENQLPQLSFSTVEIQQVSCKLGTDGQIAVQGSGGSGSTLEYSSDGVNFSTNSIFSGLDDGDYTITVRDTGNGCEYSKDFTITEPDFITYSGSQTSVTCNGDADATISGTVSGGSPPFQASLDGGMTFVTSQFTSSFSIENLGGGTLDLTIVDANQCDVTLSLSVVEPDAVTGSVAITDAGCNGEATGSITTTATGGVGQLRYSLSDFVSGDQSSPVFESLAAGNYTLSIRDSRLCQTAIPFTIGKPSPLSVTEDFLVDVSCNGGNDGSFQYLGAGGTPPYEYSLDGTTFQTSSIREGLTVGTYSVTVRDANQCVAIESVMIDEPTSVSASIASTETSGCGASDGSLEVTPQGGTAPYVYQIDGSSFLTSNIFANLSSGTYEIRVVDDNGCEVFVSGNVSDPGLALVTVESTAPFCNGGSSGSLEITTIGGSAPFSYRLDGGAAQTESTFDGLPAGIYAIEIQENNGCSQTVSATITEPVALVLTASVTDLSCFADASGAIEIAALGGTGPLMYSIDGSNFQQQPSFSGLVADSYTVYVRDENGCEETEMVTIEEPSGLVATTSINNATCHETSDGSVTLSVLGGTTPYEFSLDGITFQPTGEFADLSAGEYSITVRDANGCNIEIPASVDNQFSVVATSSKVEPLCFGDANGEITLTATGGSVPYTYQLLDGSSSPQDSPVFSGLTDGEYEFEIFDVNGCTAMITVLMEEPQALDAQSEVLDVSCNGESDGMIMITTNGGTSPYEYSIDGTSFQLESVFSNLNAGTYTVTTRDANACEVTGMIIVTEPDELLVSVVQAGRWSFTVTADGGTPPYEYSNDGNSFQLSGQFTDLGVGEYTFAVRDANACVASSDQFQVVLGTEVTEVKVYPNPVSNEIRIERVEFDEVILVDLNGTEVLHSKLNQVLLEGVPKGLYFIRLYKSNKLIYEQRLVVN